MTLGYCGSFRTRLLPDPGLMPGRSQHLLSADRFESFAAHIAPQHLEWLVIVWFHIALHYVDAFLAVQGHEQIAGHSDRWATMANSLETRAVRIESEQLYKEAKDARYQGTVYTPADIATVWPLYDGVRSAMRAALGL